MMFVTLFFAMLTPATGEVEFCNAGHNPPYHLNGQGVVAIEGGKGIILGVNPNAVYATGRLSLAAGEGIYVFTDGVTEANNTAEELFGEPRLEAVLRAAAALRERRDREIRRRGGPRLRRQCAAVRRHHHAGHSPPRRAGRVRPQSLSVSSSAYADDPVITERG